MPTESELTRRLCREMLELGAKVLVIAGGDGSGRFQTPGMPDRHVSHRGNPAWGMGRVCCWVELKGAAGRVKTNQRLIMRDMNLRGDWAYVARFMGDVIRIETPDGESLDECKLDGKEFLTALARLQRLP